MKYKYWLYYSSLDFSAYVLKVPAHITADQISYEYSSLYTPYDTLKEARAAGVAKANEDIDEYKGMKREILSKPYKFKE